MNPKNPQAASEGFVLVPREPTLEMIRSAYYPDGSQAHMLAREVSRLRREYKAMLAANPAIAPGGPDLPGCLPTGIQNGLCYPPNYANGWNDCLRLVYDELGFPELPTPAALPAAANAGAVDDALPVAWSREESIRDDEGRPIGTDEPRVVWGSECPGPDEGWHPLYGEPRAVVADEATVDKAAYALAHADSNAYSYEHYTDLARAALIGSSRPAEVPVTCTDPEGGVRHHVRNQPCRICDEYTPGGLAGGATHVLADDCTHPRAVATIGPTTDQRNHHCPDCGASWTTWPERPAPADQPAAVADESFVLVPKELPPEILAASAFAMGTGNPKHLWDFIINKLEARNG